LQGRGGIGLVLFGMALAGNEVPFHLTAKESAMTQVSDIMTRGVRTLKPTETIVQAARAMEELDVGVIPVCDGERLLGMVTDRDIVLRAVALNRPADQTFLQDVMSPEVCWCFDDDSVDTATQKMQEAQIRRIPVVDHEKHLVGMLTLADVAVKSDMGDAADALEEISEPARPQGMH
jgi:CBS domain-containing protein